MGDKDRMTLAEETSRRLRLAGLEDDPALDDIRAWLDAVFERERKAAAKQAAGP
jgi:hypothetical protein